VACLLDPSTTGHQSTAPLAEKGLDMLRSLKLSTRHLADDQCMELLRMLGLARLRSCCIHDARSTDHQLWTCRACR
jgi:hypothetical protein